MKEPATRREVGGVFVTDLYQNVIQGTQSQPETVSNSTKSRLIDALLEAWADAPAGEVSVRALVQKAGAAQSSIHYYFGNIEHLYLSASRAALEAARGWMAAQLAQLDQLAALADETLAPEVQASLIASTLADWTGPQRRLAMAWRHGCDAAWQDAWDGFWHRLATTLGLGAHAGTLACFAAGEAARHLLVWNPPLDRALLEETVAALTLWLGEQRLAPDHVHPLYRALAMRAYDAAAPRPNVPDAAIGAAATDLLAEAGHAGVTFRAVAARAEVTLGKVIHAYGTKSALLHAALHGLYRREALRGDPERLRSRRMAPAAMLQEILAAVLGGTQPVLVAYDEIERAIYNGDDHAALRGLVRAMEDPSGTWALQQMLGGVQPTLSLVEAFSATIRGVGHKARHSKAQHEELRSYALAALRPFRPWSVTRLRGP
jgi:AcrR family transcriptional regulator